MSPTLFFPIPGDQVPGMFPTRKLSESWLASWSTTNLRRKSLHVCRFQLPLLLSCSKPVFDQKKSATKSHPPPNSPRTRLQTCRKPGRKPGFKRVLSKRDIMEFSYRPLTIYLPDRDARSDSTGRYHV